MKANLIGQKRRKRNPQIWLKPSEIAAQTGFHRNSVLYWIQEGQLKAFQSETGRYRVRPKDLERFFQEYYE